MAYTWFRFYNDAVNDPKVQRLSPTLFRFWVNCLCLASANDGVLPGSEDVQFSLRLSPAQLSDFSGQLVACGLLDETEQGLIPHNWDRRQFKSDTSTERVKRFRNAAKTVSETGPDQTRPDTESETDRKKVISGFFGKNGKQSEPLSEEQKLALFQRTLAESFSDKQLGWRLVGEAASGELFGA